jgi:drug/metabolite transporter (DMT)-like permease
VGVVLQGPAATSSTRPRFRILVEPLVAALLWGGVFAAAKLGMQEIPVPSFLVLRLVIATALLVVIAGGVGWLGSLRASWRVLIAAGLAQTTFQVLLLQGINQTSAALSAILLASAPLMTAAWLGVTGVERLVPRQWLGLGMGLAGVALLVGVDGLSGGGTLVGNLIAFGAGAAWAWYGLAIGPLARAVGPIRAACATVGMAALVLLPFGIGEVPSLSWSQVSITGWAGLLYGAVLGLVVATALWVRSVERWGTQATMNYSYLEPVAAVVIAAVLLGELLRPIQGVGAVLALLGVYLASAPVAEK